MILFTSQNKFSIDMIQKYGVYKPCFNDYPTTDYNKMKIYKELLYNYNILNDTEYEGLVFTMSGFSTVDEFINHPYSHMYNFREYIIKLDIDIDENYLIPINICEFTDYVSYSELNNMNTEEQHNMEKIKYYVNYATQRMKFAKESMHNKNDKYLQCHLGEIREEQVIDIYRNKKISIPNICV